MRHRRAAGDGRRLSAVFTTTCRSHCYSIGEPARIGCGKTKKRSATSTRVVAVPNTVADSIFTIALPRGQRSCGLFGLMAAAAGGELIDLPGMAAHQRAPVVTVLAILMHVLARYAKVDRASESSWARAWDELIGPDALRVTAPYSEVAFLQPPTNEPTSQQSIEAADLLLPNVEHEVKRTWATLRSDTAIFSLIGSLSRPNVKDHRSSTRTGPCAVLPSAESYAVTSNFQW